MSVSVCPRCGYQSYEKLKSYSHCYNCNYFFDACTNLKSDRHLREAIALLKKVSRKKKTPDSNSPQMIHVPPACPPINVLMF